MIARTLKHSFSLKCQSNILKRKYSGGYLDIVKIKIKRCLGSSVLDNKGISDLGTIKIGGKKKSS